MELRDYLLLLARHWVVLAATAVVGVATAAVLIVAATPQYESRAQVLFTARDAGSGQDLAYAGTYVQSRIQTYKDLATTETVLAPVVEELGLDQTPDELAESTEIEVSQIDTLVDIAVRDPSAQEAARKANAVADSLLGRVAELEGSTTGGSGARVEGVVVGQAAEEDEPAAPDTALWLLAGLLAGVVTGFAVLAVRHVAGARETP